MSRLEVARDWSDRGSPSVKFMPAPGGVAGGEPADLRGMPHARQIVAELAQPLADLVRRVERLGPVSGGTVALIAGCGRGTGCTSVAAALAAVAAASRPTLLVDGDLTNPGLAPLAGLRSASGWDEAVRGECSIGQVLQYLDASRRLACLLLRRPAPRPDELLATAAARKWLSGLREDYGLVVVDGGSVWESGARWAPWADVSLLVCDSGRTAPDDWARGWDRLEDGGSHVLGLVETFV